MRLAPRSAVPRRGMTLLEVLLAMAIFLFSLAAISQLFNSASDQATEIQAMSRATRLAQSKMSEFTAGVISLQSAGSGSFDEEPEWDWSADIQSNSSAVNLYTVTITVSRSSGKGKMETSLTQYILDPKMKGTCAASSSSSSSSSSGSNSTSSTGSN